MSFDDWLPGNAFRQGAAFWRSVLPQLAEPAAAGMAQIADLYGFSPASTVRELLGLVESQLRGRRLQLAVGEAEVELTIEELASDTPPLGPPLGQFGHLQIRAADVSWDGGHLSALTVRLRNLHVQPGDPPLLVAAPIEVEAVINQDDLDGLLGEHAPGVRVELVDGEVRARVAGREGLGHLAIDIAAEGSQLVLRPRSAAFGKAPPLRLPGRFLPSLKVDAAAVVPDLLVVGVEVEESTVIVRGVIPERRVPAGATRLDGIIKRLRSFTGTRFELPDDG